MGQSEIDAVRALLNSKPRPVGWAERRQRLDEVGSIWPVADDVKLDAEDKSVILDRPSVCGASTKRLNTRLSSPHKIIVGDRCEREQLDLVDLDHHRTASVDTSDLDLWSRPEAVGDGDGSVGDSIAKVRAELHAAIVSPAARQQRSLAGAGSPMSSGWMSPPGARMTARSPTDPCARISRATFIV